MPRVQTKSANATTATFTVAVTSGNAIVGAIGYASGVTLNSITDDKGNTLTPVVRTKTDSLNAYALALFRLLNITNGPITVTGNFSATPTDPFIILHEVSGLTAAALDQDLAAETATLTANATTTGNVTTTADGEYIFGVAINSEEGFGALHAGTSPNAFTVGESQNSTYPFFCSEDFIQSAQGAIAATFTCDSIRRCQVGIMTFKTTTGSASLTPTVGAGSLTPILAVPVVSTVKIPITP